MSGCGTFKCARRLYEGHGQSSYRPVNHALSAETASRLSKMQQDREAQDRLWCNSQSQSQSQTEYIPEPQLILERKLPVLPNPVSNSQSPYIAQPVWAKSFQTK